MTNDNNPQNKDKKPIYATFNRRVIASLLDTILSTIILIPVINILDKLLGLSQKLDISKIQDPQNIDYQLFIDNFIANMDFMALQGLVLSVCVFILWRYKAATPGKMILNLKIVDEKTLKKPTNKQFILRLFGYLVSTIPLGLGFVWIYFDDKNQAWHDKIAKTLVIKS